MKRNRLEIGSPAQGGVNPNASDVAESNNQTVREVIHWPSECMGRKRRPKCVLQLWRNIALGEFHQFVTVEKFKSLCPELLYLLVVGSRIIMTGGALR